MNGGALNSRGLTVKQSVFTNCITDWQNRTTFGNGVKSAQFAGYKGCYSTLGVVAYENLRKPKIIREIKRRMKKILSSDEVLQELSDIGSADWRDFVEIRYGKDGQVIDASLKLGDKIRALELTGKYHKLFTDRVESTDTTERDSLKLQLTASIEDLAQEMKSSLHDAEYGFQLRMADKSRKSYDPTLDPNVHAESWPSGNLLNDSEPETVSEASQ